MLVEICAFKECFTFLFFSSDKEKFRQDLFNIAMTTLSSKIVTQEKERFANLCVDAVLRLKVGPKKCLYHSS